MSVSTAVSSRKRVCLVTNELYPLSAGGIGRLMHNFARQNEDLGFPVELHFLVPHGVFRSRDDRNRVQAAYGEHVTFHECGPLSSRMSTINVLLDKALYRDWTLDQHYARSFEYYQGLLAAQESLGEPFDIIEFPDFGGWALATLDAKQAGLHFQDTLITARLHSSQGLLYEVERFAHHPSLWLGVLFDAERRLLDEADIIVGHVPSVTRRNREHFNFSEAWYEQVQHEFPPILLDDAVVSNERTKSEVRRLRENSRNTDPDFVFSSRLQEFKRPDLFIKAAIGFLQKKPKYGGVFRLVSYGWNEEYIEGLRSLIPDYLKDLIVFHFDTDPEVRIELIRTSIVVVPSDFESLCLFAFEASQLGSKVLLNKRCEAFGDSDRWVDNENCMLFEDDAESLALCMEAALQWEPTSKASALANTPYWVRDFGLRPSARADEVQPRCVLVCYGAETREQVEVQLASLSFQRLKADRVLFVLADAYFRQDEALVELLGSRGIEVHRAPGFGLDARSFSNLLAGLDSELISLVPVGYEAHPDFLKTTVNALQSDEKIDLVCGHLRIVQGSNSAQDGIRVFGGSLPSTVLLSSRASSRVCTFRRSLLEEHPFDHRAGAMWFEAWSRDLVGLGKKLLVLPSVGADILSFADRQMNSKHLTAGVIDRVGQHNELPSRLLGLDVVQAPDKSINAPILRRGVDLKGAQLVHPDRQIRPWPLVERREDLGGLLVHPTVEGATMVLLEASQRRLKSLRAAVRNASSLNTGFEVAIGLVAADADEETFVSLRTDNPIVGRAAVSNWTYVAPGAQQQLSVDVRQASFGFDRIVVMTRLPKNGGEEHAHAVLLHIEERLDTNLL